MALQGNDAAFVAAALTQAEATLFAAAIVAKGTESKRDFDFTEYVRLSYETHLDYALKHNPTSR